MNFTPTLRACKVPLNLLLLDPNNPRFLDDHTAPVQETDFHTPQAQIEAANRMNNGPFRLEALQRQIESNGWQPVDRIFVRRVGDHYVVLEGNRRLMALRALDREKRLDGALRDAVDPLPVVEVVNEGDLQTFRNQIAYLLGVRHQTSLKRWSPFAQAHDIYGRYLTAGGFTDATFKWNDHTAATVGEVLNVDPNAIRERVRVYRAMMQLGNVPAIKTIGMAGKFYSLVREAVAPRRATNPLRQYIVQDDVTLLLDEQSLQRMDNLCHFSAPGRANAPVGNPDEWRPLSKILADTNDAKRAEMLHEIESNKRAPSEVYAERLAELRQPRWDRWLFDVAQLLRTLQIANLDSGDAPSKEVCARLATLLDQLSAAN